MLCYIVFYTKFLYASKLIRYFYVMNKLFFNLMLPIGFLMKYCVQFILTFSKKYSNVQFLVILILYLSLPIELTPMEKILP